MTIPIPDFGMEVPERLTRGKGTHDRLVKESIHEELEDHRKPGGRLEGHFHRDATQKYGYEKRISRVGRLSYYAWKSQRHGVNSDLVKTGASKSRVMSEYKITVTGSSGNGFRGRLITRMAIDVIDQSRRKPTNTRKGATLDVMVREIARFTDDEIREVAKSIRDRYVHKVNNDISPRQRIKV